MVLVRIRNFLDGSAVKNLPAYAGDSGWSLGQEDSLEDEIATHSSSLTWKKSPGKKCPGGYSPLGRKELDMSERLSVNPSQGKFCKAKNKPQISAAYEVKDLLL